MSASLSSASYKSTDYRRLKHQMKNILNPGHCFRGYESRTGQWVVPTRNNFREMDVGPSCPEGTSCCHGRWRSDSRYVTPFSTSAIKFTGNVRFPNICQKLDVIWMHTHKSIPVFHGQIYTWHVLCKATSLPACLPGSSEWIKTEYRTCVWDQLQNIPPPKFASDKSLWTDDPN